MHFMEPFLNSAIKEKEIEEEEAEKETQKLPFK